MLPLNAYSGNFLKGFKFVINLATASGLTIRAGVMPVIDEVIECG